MKTVTLNKTKQLHHWMGIAIGVAGFIAFYGIPSLSLNLSSLSTSEASSSELPSQAEIHVQSLGDVYKDLNYSQVKQLFAKNLRGQDRKKAAALAKHLLSLTAKYQISPSIIMAIIQSESTYRFDAQSDVGAIGIMQVRPSTASFIARRNNIKNYHSAKDLFDPMVNMSVGVAYVAYLRELFGDSEHYVAAYNLGPTTVSRMLSTHTFTLGKVTKYVTEIHANVKTLRDSSNKTFVANH